MENGQLKEDEEVMGGGSVTLPPRLGPYPLPPVGGSPSLSCRKQYCKILCP